MTHAYPSEELPMNPLISVAEPFTLHEARR
ncbi:MAG: hypothetical protein QOK10_1746, partial [Pseudonocardiales bacterium]|nr:hypothetical protein [Pseudonocardiales bacterium]